MIKKIILETIYDLFGNDITDQSEKERLEKKKKEANKARAQKAAQTRAANKAKKDREYDDNLMIARGFGDLFGNKPTEQERAKAEEYIQKNPKRKKNKKKNTNESKIFSCIENDERLSHLIKEAIHDTFSYNEIKQKQSFFGKKKIESNK